MSFSARSAHDPEPNALARALAARRAAGLEVLDLTVSNPTTAGIPYDGAAVASALASPGALVYEPAAFGTHAAREAVAREVGADASRVVLTASTSEAYAFLFTLLCDPGDEVLVPAPSYPLFGQLAVLNGVRLSPYRLRYDGAWHVDTDSLRRARTARTRAVLAVSPNNPTGSFLKAGELAAMRSLGLPLVCDEVFASYPLSDAAAGGDERRVTSVAREGDDSLVFALGGLSKLAALPQMKLGWTVVAGPPGEAAEALRRLEWIADAYLSVGAPVQAALPALLATRERAAGAIRARTRANLEAARQLLAGTAVTLLSAEGGWYATLRLPLTRPEEAWALALLEGGVYVHPGAFFDFAQEAFVVVSLLTPEDRFAEGIRRVAERVDRAGT